MYNAKADILGEVAERTLIQLTDDEKLGTVNDDRITSALTRSAAMIDGYCGKRYEVPFDPSLGFMDFIKSLDLDIAIYNLFSRKENVPENRKDRYKNAEKTLVQIAEGKVTLGAADKKPEVFSSATPEVLSGGRTFSRNSLKGF